MLLSFLGFDFFFVCLIIGNWSLATYMSEEEVLKGIIFPSTSRYKWAFSLLCVGYKRLCWRSSFFLKTNTYLQNSRYYKAGSHSCYKRSSGGGPSWRISWNGCSGAAETKRGKLCLLENIKHFCMPVLIIISVVHSNAPLEYHLSHHLFYTFFKCIHVPLP